MIQLDRSRKRVLGMGEVAKNVNADPGVLDFNQVTR